MVLLPLVSLLAVRETAPTDVRLRAAVDGGAPEATSDLSVEDDRLARHAQAFRSSRSAGQQRVFLESDEEATTTTVAPTTVPPTTAPTTTAATATARATSTTTSTARPKPTTTTTVRATTTSTTAKPTTTTSTTARPATTTTTAAAASADRSQEGGASYHDYPDPRTCAHRTLPKGTTLRVTNVANGRRTTCVVNDRGPYVESRIVDLSRETFAEIANISQGVIRVRIEW